jgi:nucleolar protein 15
MGTKIGKKGGVKPKRAIVADRPKESKKVTKKAQKEEELQLPSESESESESEDEQEEQEVKAKGSSEQSESDKSENDEELGGFSSTDESESEEEQDDEEESDEPQEEKKSRNTKTSESHEVKKLPTKDVAESKKTKKTKKGVIYIGRLPEGFEEDELKKYFNQFGDITNVRLPRNKKTGRSKHYAFVEFENVGDAKVAQETMNNYLLLNHQLKVNLVDEEFKSSKKFKKAYFKIEKPKKDIKTLNENANRKKEDRKRLLKKAGFNF